MAKRLVDELRTRDRHGNGLSIPHEQYSEDQRGDSWEPPEPSNNGLPSEHPGDHSLVATFTAAELLGMELPEPKWAIPSIIAEGLTIVAGKPKIGKSWLTLHLALAVADGGMALGRIAVSAGDVLYLALEDNRRRLQGRLSKLLAPTGAAAPERLTLATSWPRLGEDKGLYALLQWLDGHPAARFVVIDTLAKIRPSRAVSRDRYGEDYQDVGELKAVADKYGVAMATVHHVRKMEASDPIDAVSGTLGLTGAADGVLVLKRERGQADATLFVTGRDMDEQELALQWNPQFALWTIMGQADEYRLTRERAELLGLLRKEGRALSPSEVAPLLQKTTNACKLLLWKLEKDGWLINDGTGKYQPCK